MSPITELIGGAKAYGWGSLIPDPARKLGSYFQLANSTSVTNSINFTSIPSTYDHLELRYVARSGWVNPNPGFHGAPITLRINNNGSSGPRFSWANIAASASSSNITGQYNSYDDYESPWMNIFASNGPSNGFGGGSLIIFNYASTSYPKPYVAWGVNNGMWDTNEKGTHGGVTAGLYDTTAAVNSVYISNTYNNNFLSGSSVALYGIKTTPTDA